MKEVGVYWIFFLFPEKKMRRGFGASRFLTCGKEEPDQMNQQGTEKTIGQRETLGPVGELLTPQAHQKRSS